MMLEEPIYVKGASKIRGTLKVHRFIRKLNRIGILFPDFFELSTDVELLLRRDYQVSNQTVCGLDESERNNNKCSHYGVNYVNSTDQG